jgi:hypothetical protein
MGYRMTTPQTNEQRLHRYRHNLRETRADRCPEFPLRQRFGLGLQRVRPWWKDEDDQTDSAEPDFPEAGNSEPNVAGACAEPNSAPF